MLRGRFLTRASGSGLALIAGSAGLALSIGAGISGATTGSQASAAPGITPASPIKQVVYVIMENHSFDNLLGAYCLQTRSCNGAISGLTYGSTVPTPLKKSPDVVPVVGHSAGGQTGAIDNGKMDGYSKIAGCTASSNYACYSQYLPSQEPNLIDYVKAFAISDATFEDYSSPSWGSHISAVAAQTDGFDNGAIPFVSATKAPAAPGWGCDSGRLTDWWDSAKKAYIHVPSCVPDYSLPPSSYPYGGAFKATPVAHVDTIMDRLDTARLSWHIYAAMGGSPSEGSGNSSGYGWAICPTFADCLYTNQVHNFINNNPKANGTDQFQLDAEKGVLPSVSIVTPTQNNSEHNADSMTVGDDWVGRELSAIENGPQWDSTAVFVTWDDCGCFYDHAPPPGDLGIRVPMLVVSPYVKAGAVDHHVAQFASVLSFIEHNFDLTPLANADADAYGYQGLFNFAMTPRKPAIKPITAQISSSEQQYLVAHPGDADDPT